ncbi:MAG: radical SAM protein [bacterium]|nr:radical SAM protein [bacterium]
MEVTFDTTVVCPPVIQRHERGEWTLLHDLKNHTVVRVNNQGLAVVEAVARHPRLGDAVAELAARFSMTFDDIAPKVLQFIFDMSNSGFLHIETYKQIKIKRPRLEAPKGIYIQNTERCNLGCVYCFNQEERAHFTKDHPEMTTEQLKWAIDQIADFGIPQINFCGGEPTLRDDLLEVAAHARDRGRLVCLVTNGREDGDEFLAAAADLFDVVWVSIDSHRREINDRHRGKDSYEPAMRSLRKLVQISDRRAIILAAAVISSNNWEELAEMKRYFLEEIGVDRFRATSYSPGCAVSLEEEWSLQPPPFVRDASVLPPPDTDFADFSAGFDLELEVEYDGKGGKKVRPPARVINHCGVGNGELAMLSNGDIYPCQLLCKPEFLAGNLFDQPLPEIYRESEILQQLRELTVDRIPGCSTCDVRYVCGGSCRATALEMHGDMEAHIDYQCDLYRRNAVDNLWRDSKIPIEHVAEARKKLLDVRKQVEGEKVELGVGVGGEEAADVTASQEEG